MHSVDAKIVRAGEHLELLSKEIHEYLRAAKRTTVPKVDGDVSWLVHWVENPVSPMHLSTVVGDTVFNLRSALDNLICGLIRTEDSTAPCSKSQFPICTKVEQWENHSGTWLKGVPPDAQKIIKGIQPCFRDYGTPEADPLAVLNTLCNMDKHRAVLLTGSYDRHVEFSVHLNDGRVHKVMLTEPMHAGSPTTIPLQNIHPRLVGTKVRIESSGTGFVIFHEEGAWGERPVLELMFSLLEHVKDRVIPRFKPFFTPPV